MKMYMDHSQEVGELGCQEEVVQGTDTRGSVLFQALSRDGGSVNSESRSKHSSCRHNSAAANGFGSNSRRLYDDARLTDKPMPMSALRASRDDVSTTAPSDAAGACDRRADAVGGRHRHRRHEGSSDTTSSVSLLTDAASGHYQKRRMVHLSQISKQTCPSSNGNHPAVTAAVAYSSMSRGGPLVITVPPPTKSNLLASPSRSRHRPKATVSEVVLDDGSTWDDLGKVREAPASREASSSLDSYSDEDYQPAEMHHQQYQGRGHKVPKPGVIFQASREQFDLQQSRVLVISGIGDEPNGYVLAESSSYPAVPSSLSILPIYNNSTDSAEMGLDYEQCSENADHSAVRLLDCFEVQSARRLQRVVSNEGSHCSSSSSSSSSRSSPYEQNRNHTLVAQTRIPAIYYHAETREELVPPTENTPLDLSMGRRVAPADGYITSQSDEGYGDPVSLVVDEAGPFSLPTNSEPPSALMQLADACTFVLEKETRTSKSCESSPPPSSPSDSNSCHSVYQEEETLQLQSESTYFTTSQEYLTESQENSLDNCVSLQVQELSDIKYEISNDFQPGGIILNSNVLGDRVFHDTTAFGLQQIDVCSEDDKGGVLREVANLTVEDGYTDGLYRTVYTSDGHSPSTPSMDDYHNYYRGGQDSSSGSECSSFTSSSRHANGGMATSVICTSGGGDNKKRLRLGKAEYESMSEQDRKIRHRVLDNQRSKQYRERRRRMITKLQCDITNEENNNKALKDRYDYYEKRLTLVKEVMGRVKSFTNSAVLVPSSHFVKAEC